MRRASGQRLPANHLDVIAKILLRQVRIKLLCFVSRWPNLNFRCSQQDAGRILIQNKGGLAVIDFTETGTRLCVCAISVAANAHVLQPQAVGEACKRGAARAAADETRSKPLISLLMASF